MARGRNSTTRGIRLSDGLLADIKEYAEVCELSFNEYVVKALEHAALCSRFGGEELHAADATSRNVAQSGQ